jgi:putative endonuclease
MPFVYLLECADGTLYAGWTTDLAQRVAAHNRGAGARYTRGRRPVRLAYWEESESPSAALRREAALRRLSRRQKLALIAERLSTEDVNGRN